MKYIASIVALVLALGIAGSREASADSLSGRVVQIGAGGSGGVFAGNVLGRNADGTYWVVFIHSSMGDSASRLLTVASANHGINKAYFSSVTRSSATSFVYYAEPATWYYQRSEL
ncbi:MAG: hypothetical protein HYY18_10780 [Planctomycetes bacterium]|nr:hypothetical protein [Planctomycetota bacterium]